LKTIWKTLIDISTFTIVLFLFMFIFTILGMELFGYKARFNSQGQVDLENGDPINQNFDNFVWAFTTVFIVLTADSWSAVWFAHYRTVGSWSSTIFFYIVFYFGNRILLNLFLAILLENFDEDRIEQELKKEVEIMAVEDGFEDSAI